MNQKKQHKSVKTIDECAKVDEYPKEQPEVAKKADDDLKLTDQESEALQELGRFMERNEEVYKRLAK